MRKLTKENIQKKAVDTIPQYYILDYLKKNLNVDEFKIYLIDRCNMKVIDKTGDYLYFNYNESTKEITYDEKLKEYDYEIGF